LRYLELVCEGFLSAPKLGFARVFSPADLEVLQSADQLLREGIPQNAVKMHLLKNYSFGPGRKAASVEKGANGAGKARYITVSSGKGGVGKSTLSLNLGVELRRMGFRVVVLDGDLGTANLHVMAGLRAQRNLKDVVSGECTIQSIIRSIPGGPDLVPGASGIFDLANLSRHKHAALLTEFVRLERLYDIILIDTAAGVAAPVIEFIASSDLALIVTSPEKTAITDAYALIKLSLERNRRCRLGLVANRVRSIREGAAVIGRISSCAQRFLNQHVLEFGCVWEDTHARLAVNEGSPVAIRYPQSKISIAIRKLAHVLREKELASFHPLRDDSGFGSLVGGPARAIAGSIPS